MERLRTQVSKHKNRAVYEAVKILAKLMDRSPEPQARAIVFGTMTPFWDG